MKLLWAAIISGLLAAPAWAQSAYVTGAIGAEIVRSTSVASSGSTFATGNGESWSGAIRLGTVVTSRFGIELEWHRSGTIDNEGNGPIYIATDVPRAVVRGPIEGGIIPDAAIFPIIRQQTRLRALPRPGRTEQNEPHCPRFLAGAGPPWGAHPARGAMSRQT